MTLAPLNVSDTDAVIVRPCRPLVGTVRVDGSKNAALPLLATAASLRRSVHLSGVPASADVQLMLGLLPRSGYRVAHPVAEPRAVVIHPQDGGAVAGDLEDAARIRASYYLVSPLLAAYGQADLPWPGGCRIGQRGMDLHFSVYRLFGDTVTLTEDGYRVRAGSRRDKVALTLPFRSRGASIAAILRAVVAGSCLELGNPNLSPETTGVLAALRTAGWQTHTSEEKITLAPPSHLPDSAMPLPLAVPGDKIEAGTLACAIAASGGEGRIEGIHSPDVKALTELLAKVSVPVTLTPGALIVHRTVQPTGQPLRALASLDPDGLDADFEPPLMALALTLPGTHQFADAINPGRHDNLLPQLASLGARVEEVTPTQCRLTGPQQLTGGATVRATDIRTGSALLIAALNARGATTVTGLDQLRRGHADLPAKLRALGADITEGPR
ncbi:UDP-N-acetylglucosamine 1-carboxyvinyltransferase [Streptomyces sp. NPDC005962]|uniref:UDP-N-acetylglucosamine 1-carboxyvinyltransferase n=1 Tax=Streptomyces sp. NPDC005962 TaxID=3154466 RepID=UPI0033FF8DB6